METEPVPQRFPFAGLDPPPAAPQPGSLVSCWKREMKPFLIGEELRIDTTSLHLPAWIFGHS